MFFHVFLVFFCFCKDAKRIFYPRIRADTGVCPYTQPYINTQTMKKETIKFIIQLIISILTAIATTLGVTSCLA